MYYKFYISLCLQIQPCLHRGCETSTKTCIYTSEKTNREFQSMKSFNNYYKLLFFFLVQRNTRFVSLIKQNISYKIGTPYRIRNENKCNNK